MSGSCSCRGDSWKTTLFPRSRICSNELVRLGRTQKVDKETYRLNTRRVRIYNGKVDSSKAKSSL